MSRTVTLRATFQELVGDETYEVWLQHESDAWGLVDAGDVDDSLGHEDFPLFGLTDGASYSAQVRLKRAGRYRVGYLSGDPDSWPSSSRCDFVVGSLADVGAPTLDAVDDWERDSSTSSHFTIHITPNDTSKDLELVRDGAVLHTFSAPLSSTISYDDVDPPLAESHSYKARHISGSLTGPDSATITKFAGPPPITGFALSSPTDQYGKYDVEWTDDSRTYRIEDDYLCVSTVYSLLTGGAAVTGGTFEETKEGTLTPAGSTQSVSFHARMRAEVTSFTVTDVSDWATITITMLIDDPDDDTNYNTCP